MAGPPGFDAVVLAGGGGQRLGGVDKAGLRLGGVRLLDRVLACLDDAETVVVVGPEKLALARADVVWAREDPPGGGPAAALAAALPALRCEVVVVLAVDLPFLRPAVVEALLDALDADPALDGVQATDATGRVQPLLAAYRTGPLALAARDAGDAAGLPVRRLLGGLRLTTLALGADPAGTDCDTPDDLARARALVKTLGRRR